ncbi:MAG: translation initiation factor IF-2 subunit gamma [Candidatus Aenigmarchaeota archaeon]|nr:translation initiation factor IF-2 subunit gamma [Candidatus Aenigmarchaeota archaeon]
MNLKFIPEVNIGLLGHVDHGKTTLVDALTGKWTDTHSEEIKRGITIKLGYADATFYECPKCKKHASTNKCQSCFTDTKPLRTVSFVDAPGHESLMATVLTGSAILDGALLLIAANEKCPLPQTREHLTALEVVGIKNIVIIQNKIDLVSQERVKEHYEEIKEFVKGTIAENSPIIPISAQQKINIEYIIEAINEFIPTPKRDEAKNPKMYIARSFDINKPGSSADQLVGGILGGSVVQGVLKVDGEIEIRPGMRIDNEWKPIFTRIVSLRKASFEIEEAGPGGLLGLMTKLDPYVTKADVLAGNVVGLPGKLPKVRDKIRVDSKLLERVVGTKEMEGIQEIKPNEMLMVNIGSMRSVGIVGSIKGRKVEMNLKIPICGDDGDRVVISRQVLGRWRLIGHGTLIG